jgi:hypothetical protein
MANGDGRISWSFALQLMQILIIPTFLGTIAIFGFMWGLSSRLSVVEATMKNPPAVDVSLRERLAVQEAQNRSNTEMIAKVSTRIEERMDRLEDILSRHDARPQRNWERVK